MAWFKVDDQLAFHSKTMLAGNEAMGLWVRAGSWSSAHFTDGFIPEHMALAMAPPMANSDLPSGAIDLPSRLVEAGFWHKVEGGYQFHDWEDFQPDGKAEKQRQEDTRKARSEAGKKGAEARWGKKNNDSKDMAEPMANTMAKDGKANGKPMAPSRPVPTLLTTPSGVVRGSGGKRRKPETPLPDDWEPTSAHAEYARKNNLDLAKESERFKYHAQANDRRQRDWQASFRMWLSKARPSPEASNPWNQ